MYALAEIFNGGGHIRAAGVHYKGNYDDLLDALVTASKKHLKMNGFLLVNKPAGITTYDITQLKS